MPDSNHYPLFPKGREKRTLCGILVPRDNALGGHPITCLDCRARLAEKVLSERGAAKSDRQYREFHLATAQMFERHLAAPLGSA